MGESFGFGPSTSSGGGSSMTVEEDGAPLASRSNLNFRNGLVATDDGGTDSSIVDADYAGTAQVADIAAVEAAGSSPKLPHGDHVHSHPVFTTGDLHSEYVREATQDVANGYAGLDANAVVLAAVIPATHESLLVQAFLFGG